MDKLFEHQLETTGNGMRCAVCQHTWKREPVHPCPGVPWYEWESAPEGLFTNSQVQGLGLRLKKGAAPSGCIWYAKKQGWIWLYALDQTEERPAPSDKQVAAAERARARQRALRTCKQCGTEQDSRRDLEAGVCAVCWHKDFLEFERSKAATWARGLLARADWVILDTETTGLGDDAEVIQVAVLDPHSGEWWQSLARPQEDIPAEATQIHGITNEMVRSAPTWPAVHRELVELTGKLVVIYNANFDVRMLRQTSRRYELQIELEADCAMERYARWVGEWNDYYSSFRWQPLSGGDHSAIGDCRATLEVIKKMAGCEVKDD